MKFLLKLFVFLIAIIITIGIYFDIPYPFGSVIVFVPPQKFGLGNHMFRYAAAYNLAKKTNSKLYVMIASADDLNHEESKNTFKRGWLLENFNIPKENIIYKNSINTITLKKTYVTDDNFFELSKKKNWQILIINDIFESEIFFEDVKDDIIKMYQLQKPYHNDLISKISKKNSVCVHVRRGDVLLQKNKKEFFLSIDYQKKAMNLAKNIIKDPEFFIFSDSPDLAQQELAEFKNLTFIHHSPLEDFSLMNQCSNNIIGNSTFSWWAAYLNKSQDRIVIAPFPRHNEYYFMLFPFNEGIIAKKRILYSEHAYPTSWIKISTKKISN